MTAMEDPAPAQIIDDHATKQGPRSGTRGTSGPSTHAS
jgi:hypothetical protein